MTANSILPPYPTFQGIDGQPLEAGYIYVGEPGFEARTTPKASFFDIGLTVPTGTASGAAVRTSGGYPARNGSPSAVYVDGDFSIAVTDKSGVLLYSALTRSFAFGLESTVGDPVLAPDGTLSFPGFAFISDVNTGFALPSALRLQTVVNGALISEATATGTVFYEPITGAGFSSSVLGLIDPDLQQIGAIAAVDGDIIARIGGVWARVAKGTAGQALVMNAGATAPEWGGVFTKSYASAEQTITAAGQLILAHGLGAVPKLITYELVCKVADLGYTIGQVVEIGVMSAPGGTDSYNAAPIKDATNITIRFADSAGTFILLNATTGAGSPITNTSWRLVVRAYA